MVSVETSQAHEMLGQHQTNVCSNFSLNVRTPLGSIHQLVKNNSLSSRYSTQFNGECQTKLSSRHWQHSRSGDSCHVRLMQRDTRNVTSKTNTYAYIEYPSSSHIHLKCEGKQTMTRRPSVMLKSNKEKFPTQSDQSPEHIQRMLLLKKNPKLNCKKELEMDAASTLCSLSLIQPRVNGKECIERTTEGCCESFVRASRKSGEYYPTRLSMPNDESELNSLHCFVRQELLELFIVPDKEASEFAHSFTGSLDDDSGGEYTNNNDIITSARDSPNMPTRNVSTLTDNDKSNSFLHERRVGFRCVHCAHLHPKPSSISSKDIDVRYSTELDLVVLQNPNSPMNVFYPKSLAELYRLVCKWQRVHFKKCKHIPPPVRRMYQHLKATDKTRGKTKYWVSSAIQLGLVDSIKPRGGIRYDSTKC